MKEIMQAINIGVITRNQRALGIFLSMVHLVYTQKHSCGGMN
jgi:hypothetical protein